MPPGGVSAQRHEGSASGRLPSTENQQRGGGGGRTAWRVLVALDQAALRLRRNGK